MRLPAGGGIVELQAEKQRVEGKLYIAEGNVDVRYNKLRMRADRIEYNIETYQAAAAGRVQFDYETQHLDADEAHFNLRTGKGLLKHVSGSVRVHRKPNPNVLLSDNPLLFEAREVERVDEQTYEIRGAIFTVCPPDHPIWKFHAPRATIKLQRSVILSNASFRIFTVPVLYLPKATAPAGPKLRQSGFLVPHIGHSSRKGFVTGDSFYWAPSEWADITAGAEYLSRRGFSQTTEFRVRPFEGARIAGNFFGVHDRGVPVNGVRVPQGGHQTHIELDALLPDGWRAVADLNQLTSLRFRLAFAETFREAANPEIRSSAFVTNNFRGLSLNFALTNYKNFLTADPETAVVLRSAPGARFGSVEQAPWADLPIYFGFDASAEAMHRNDPGTLQRPPLTTPAAVQRGEIAPRMTVPLRWGPWLGVTPTFVLRATRYGAQLSPTGTVVSSPLHRVTGETTVDIRPPSLARVWEGSGQSWKHTIEPQAVYRYVRGVNNFGSFLRFDENDTLTDTNELEYSVTQRLYFREGDGNATEFLSWRVAQKYYFDPTFNGALVPGQRNVFQALNSITPFAFGDAARRFSPLVSDLRMMPGSHYDAQVRFDYDTLNGRLTSIGTLMNFRPYRESFLTLAHFATRANPVLQPRSNQIRALFGYGEINRPGLNGSFAMSYDVRQRFFQNQVAQVSWNGSCCGIAFEFRRLALGSVRNENQYRVALMIANIGTFGSLRRHEKIF